MKAVHKLGLFEVHAPQIVLEVDLHIQDVPAFLAKDINLALQVLNLVLEAAVDPAEVLTVIPLFQ